MTEMETLIHADIFFFVTTIAVVLISIALLIILFYVIRSVRKFDMWIEKIGGHIEGASADVQEIVREIRENVLFVMLQKLGGKKRRKTIKQP